MFITKARSFKNGSSIFFNFLNLEIKFYYGIFMLNIRIIISSQKGRTNQANFIKGTIFGNTFGKLFFLFAKLLMGGHFIYLFSLNTRHILHVV